MTIKQRDITMRITVTFAVTDDEIRGMRNWSDYDDDTSRACAIAREVAHRLIVLDDQGIVFNDAEILDVMEVM